MTWRLMSIVAMLSVQPPALAGPAIIEQVHVAEEGEAFRFAVTVRHADTGWSHYANGWEVRAPNGTVLGRRTLHHPHVNEQPFTRSLSGVEVPASIHTVTVHVQDSVHGEQGPGVPVTLPGRSSTP